MTRPDMNIYGVSGLRYFGEGGLGKFIRSDFLRQLQGREAAEFYFEMAMNSPIIGAYLNLVDSYLRSAEFRIFPANESPEALRIAKFIEECLFHDLDIGFQELISQIGSMVVYGYSYFEHVYKIRLGRNSNDLLASSRYNDGHVGLASLAMRSQRSLWAWDIDKNGTIGGMWQSNFFNQGKAYTPIHIPVQKATLFRTSTYENNPEGKSMLRNAVIDYIYLKRIQEYKMIGIEHDHVGIPIIKVPQNMLDPNAPDETKSALNSLFEQAKSFRQNSESVLIFPSDTDCENNATGFKFELIGSPGSKMYDLSEEERLRSSNMLKSVLAQFLEFGTSDVGSFAVAKVADSIFANGMRGLLKVIQSQFNRDIIPTLIELNPQFGITPGREEELMPKMKHMGVDRMEIDDATQILHSFANAGIDIKENPQIWRAVLDATNLPPNSNLENAPDPNKLQQTSFSSDEA